MKVANKPQEYVNFEVAELLREKRFDDIRCDCFFRRSDKRIVQADVFYQNNDYTLLPTQDVAMQWLRDKFGFHIAIDWDVSFHAIISNMNEPYQKEYIGCGTYEEACNTALKYCLEEFIKDKE